MNSSEYIELLQSLIRTLSLSGAEDQTADILSNFLSHKNIEISRLNNNVYARNQQYRQNLPLLILNSHHDTVPIGNGWTRDPLGGEIEGGKLYGRGSNDAGGALVALIAAFCTMYDRQLPYNLMLIASAEEENSGAKGVASVLQDMDEEPSFAIVGEPTQMHVGIAEKGLVVIDAIVNGVSGHAARSEGINAITEAVRDIYWISSKEWPKVSDVLGPVRTTVTQISAGTAHNVIPDKCHYVIDCRVNELYELEEVVEIIDQNTKADLQPRSLKWRPSGISKDHRVVRCAESLGMTVFGSETLSDQVHFRCPSIKLGPGDSRRSHTTDEYIALEEIEEGINKYIALLSQLEL